MSPARTTPSGTLALIGGGDFQESGRALDAELLAASGGDTVLVLPTAAAFEHPARVVERAIEHFGALGAGVHSLMALRRTDAEDDHVVKQAKHASFVYVADGSPMHLRSVLKDSPLMEAIASVYRGGGVLAASGAGATVLCDPMVDPRGGAYTVGLGVVEDLAVFPYHGRAAEHLRMRSIELLPPTATLAGIDEETTLVRRPDGTWHVAGSGTVTLYHGGERTEHRPGDEVAGLPGTPAA